MDSNGHSAPSQQGNRADGTALHCRRLTMNWINFICQFHRFREDSLGGSQARYAILCLKIQWGCYVCVTCREIANAEVREGAIGDFVGSHIRGVLLFPRILIIMKNIPHCHWSTLASPRSGCVLRTVLCYHFCPSSFGTSPAASASLFFCAIFFSSSAASQDGSSCTS